METTTAYEREQQEAIARWKREEPGVVNRAFGATVRPLVWLVERVVPESAVRGALDLSNAVAQILTDSDDLLRDGGVRSIAELRTKGLELSDRLADEVHNYAIAAATAEGAGAGLFGPFGLAFDVPATITLALRTAHKIALCYGYECTSEVEKRFILGIMAASGANTVSEKVAALASLKSIERLLTQVTWRKMAEKAAEQQICKETAILAVKNLARQLGVNLTKRKALAALPLIGAAIGGSVNGWYLREVGWAARRAFQERWLFENGKTQEFSSRAA